MRLRVEPRKYCMTMASYGQCRQAAAKAMVYPAIGTLCVHWAFIGVEHLGVFHETQHQSALAKQLPKDGRLEERSVVMAKLIWCVFYAILSVFLLTHLFSLVEDLLASSYAK